MSPDVEKRTISIDEIEFDEEIYPRKHPNKETVREYTEALRAGRGFEPLTVFERNDSLISLDGRHRKEAYEEVGKEEIEVYIEDPDNPLLRAIELNSKHGLQLNREYVKELIRNMFENSEYGEIKISTVANAVGVTNGTISNWVGDIQERKEINRNALIFKLKRLGWKQKKIADKVGVSEGRISQSLENLDIKKSKDLYPTKQPPEIAEYYEIPEPLVWNIVLKGKDDNQKLEEFGTRIEYNNLWHYSSFDPRLGQSRIPLRMPGQVLLNLLRLYTEEGDLVIDPMAGGGTTVDACLIMNRKCRAYDINPNQEEFEYRREIEQNDIMDGIPTNEKAKLIYLDPPYSTQKEVEDHRPFRPNTEEGFSKQGPNEFLESMEEVIEISKNNINDDGYIAFIISALRESGEVYDFPFEIQKRFEERGFKIDEHIYVPYTGESQDTSKWKKQAKKNEFLLRKVRELMVFKED